MSDDLSKDQQIRVSIFKDIQMAKPPLEILYRAIEYIADVTNEKTFAQVAKDNIHSIYGIALGEPLLLEKELSGIEERIVKLTVAYENPAETEEEKKRIEFALLAHKKRAEQLKMRLESDTTAR